MRRIQNIISLGLVLLLFTGALVVLPGCFIQRQADDEPDEPEEPAYESPYTWENLEEEEGLYYYYKDKELVSRIGIDVSSHQKTIDWAAVAKDDIEFAFIRVGYRGSTEGELYLDEQFKANIEGAKREGIPVGVYFFSQAINEKEALEEAEFLLEHLEDTSLEYPVVYDFEPLTTNDTPGRANSISQQQATRNAKAFCKRIEGAGFDTMLYGNKKDIAKYDTELVEAKEIWFAEYGVPIPTGQFDFVIWQFSNAGVVDGIPVNVDLNIHFLEP